MPPLLTDNPIMMIDDDKFGFRPYIEELNQSVHAASSLPLTVGVFGPWGSGKSTFLRMWEDLLTGSPTVRTLWFNPWKYDQKIEVWAALLHSLLAEIQLAAGDQPLREKAGRLARAVAWLGLRGAVGAAGSLASGATGGLVHPDLFEQALDRLARDDAAHYRELNRFELDFAAAVAEHVGEDGRLVVFVDDLDRCTPAAALSVLEALKLFVGDARCVFVLAMDFDLLTAVAGGKFGEHAPDSGTAYLEKIVQLPFFLPEVALDTLRRTLRGPAGALADSDAFWELVGLGLGSNPRRVKRFLNVLNLATAIAARSPDRPPGPGGSVPVAFRLQLAKLLILRSEHRGFFHRLRTDPGLWARLESSPALPRPGQEEQVDLTLERDHTVTGFFQDARLVRLLAARPGGEVDHPPAPGPAEVVQMLYTVALAAGPDADAG